MLYRFLADLTVFIHLAFVLFVVAGGLLVISYRWLVWLHLPAVCWAALIEFSGRICPLTPLENLMRQRAGQTGYDGGFIEHYVLPLLYPANLTRELQLTLGGSVILINAAIYGWLFWRKRGGQGPCARRRKPGD